MAPKKKTTDQDPQLVESWDKFQAALEACRDYIGILGGANSTAPGYLGLYVISEKLPIPRGLYLLDDNFIIYGVDAAPEEIGDASAADKLIPILQDDGAPATLFQLILDIASSGWLSPDQMAAVKAGVIDPLKEERAVVTLEQILQRPALSPVKNFIMPRNKLHNNLPLLPLQILDGVPTDGQYTLLMQGEKGAHQVVSMVSLRYMGEAPGGRGGKLHLNAYDVQLYDAITSLYIHSQKEHPADPVVVTPQNIWACMNGGKGRATQKQLDRIAQSLDRFRFTNIYLDISDEIRSYSVKSPEAELFLDGVEDTLINASVLHFRTDRGAKVKGYVINHAPIIYAYSALRGELLTIPIELLDTSDKVSNTEDVIAFRSYIVRNIALMRQGDRDNHFMRLETIYKETGIEPPEDRTKGKSYSDPAAEIRKQARKDRNNIAGILESLKGKGYILGFEERKDAVSGAITGYQVQLDQLLIEEAKEARKKRKR